jgi:hypothetical protein
MSGREKYANRNPIWLKKYREIGLNVYSKAHQNELFLQK